MEENKKKRIRLADNSSLVWQQRRAAEEKNVHSNTVKNDNVLYRTARAAKEAEDRLYAEKAEQNRQSRTVSDSEKQRREDVRRIGEKLEVRNNLLRQERRLGMEGLLSIEDIRRAQESNRYVGKEKPLEIRKRDVRNLEGKTKRRKRSQHKLLPSERRSRLSRAKIERSRKKQLERTAKKELYITDAKGQKISVEKLRKLRGLSKNRAVTKRDTDFAKKYQISKRREQENLNKQLRLRKRDEYTR
ncbi:MAG: hypothetical protein ACI4TE_05510 [Alphaproteobacteria bacterium]